MTTIAAPASDSLTGATVVVFDRKFWTKIPPVAVELRIAYDGQQKFTMSVTASWGSHAFTWTHDIAGDFDWPIHIVAGIVVEVDVANWNATATQLTGDLLLKVITPIGRTITLFSDHINVPLPHASEAQALLNMSFTDFQALMAPAANGAGVPAGGITA